MGLMDAVGLGAVGVGSAISATAGAISSYKASKAQQAAAEKARGVIRDYTNQAIGYQQPYYTVGTENLNRLNQNQAAGQYDMPTQTYQQPEFNFQADPGYQWRMQQGANAITSNAASRGNMLSSATQKALAKYGQGFASNEYNNAYNRFNQNRAFDYSVFGDAYNRQAQEKANSFNRGISLANVGVNASNQMGNYASQGGSQMADTVIGEGNAKAAGIMGIGQAIGNFGQSIASAGQVPFYYGGGGGGTPQQVARNTFNSQYPTLAGL